MMPILALAATPNTARRAVGFLSVLGLGTEIVSWHQVGGAVAPTAMLATTTSLLPGLPAVPTAVWVDDQDSFRTAVSREVEVAVSSQQTLVDHGAIHVPRAGLDVSHWPVLGPAERAAERDRLGLPDAFVVAIDHQVPTDDIVAILSVASAAVVIGPLLPLALALGTPSVTSAESARRLGLHAGLEVEVASGRRAADRAARELAADVDRSAERSQRGRRFAEHHLDLARPAAVVRERLGLVEALAASDGCSSPRPISAPPTSELDAEVHVDLTAPPATPRRFTPRTLRARP